MNKGLAEMLHCFHSSEFVARNGADVALLERQRTSLKSLQQQQQYQQLSDQQSYLRHQFDGSIDCNSIIQEMDDPFMKSHLGLGNFFLDFNNFSALGTGFDGEIMGFDSPEIATCSVQMNSNSGRRRQEVTMATVALEAGESSSKKRKAECVLGNDSEEKRIRGDAEEVESKVTATKSRKETSTDNSKENNLKASDAQKPDFIHVRARRGQATDSHSLAERARREKISKKMKCLQDLVPGCNKITGKAGMLDEIINYVQSLQRQVEFLSMKLSALNPTLDFNMDNVFAKEVRIGNLANLPYLQFDPMQREAPSCGLNLPPSLTHPALQTSPDIFVESSCFSEHQAFSTQGTGIQSLYNGGQFH